jgi:GAF domain-containing protein
MTTISAARLARTFVEIAGAMTDAFELAEFVALLAVRTADLIPGFVVGLVLADTDGDLKLLAGSDESAKLVELFQVQQQEGPCLETFRSGEAVVSTDLRGAAARWPRFAPRAVAAGFQSVHAFPLRLRDDRLGALNVFGQEVGEPIGADDATVVQALADIAAIGLLQERAIARAELLSEQLQGALYSRVVIEQAKGAIAQARGVTVSAAFDLLRA